MRTLSLLFLLPVAALLLTSTSQADRIFKVDGSTVDDVTITKETMSEVEYKTSSGRTTKSVPSHEVLRTSFAKLPEKIDSAEVALSQEQYLDAVNDLQEFLTRFGEKAPRTAPWSVPYAYYKLIEVYEATGEYALVVSASDTLLEKAAETRYGTLAHMSKIEALAVMGEEAALTSAVGAFTAYVDANKLPSRWRLEAELRGVLFDRTLKGDKRRKSLQEVVTAAGKEAPIVRNRAQVAIAESFLSERKINDAEGIFEDVLADPKADKLTLAAAHTGMGDCLYQKASNIKKEGGDATAIFREASLHFLRVVVLYSDQVQYVPRAMFKAGRVFDELGDEESGRRAQALYNKLIRTFPGTKSAKEAKSFRRRR